MSANIQGAAIQAGPNDKTKANAPVAVLRTWRPTGSRVLSLLANAVIAAGVVWVVLLIAPGITTTSDLSILVTTVVLAAVSTLLRPLLVAMAALMSPVGAMLIGLFAQAALTYLAISIAPGVSVSSFWWALFAAWLTATLTALIAWVGDADEADALIALTLRSSARERNLPRPDARPGVLIVQIDGLSAPLLNWLIVAGNLPTLSRWVRDGSHRLVEWHTGIPSTTPASQAGILHGGARHVPAFRWYEKQSGRLVVTNRPADAAYVETLLSDGAGLLSGGGASISNVFSGDAESAALTFSRVSRRNKASRGSAIFLVSPNGFSRALVLTLGEMVKELFQARKQRRRDIQPRISRAGSYVALRAATNVLLRELNTVLIAEQMGRGAPVIYCDYVDYDEIAHHAGPTRPESLAALTGLDRVIGRLERLAREGPNPYEIVLISDHGQSQGATFRQRYGASLDDVARGLMSGPISSSTHDERVEEWGPINALLTEFTAQNGVGSAMARRGLRDRWPAEDVNNGSSDGHSPADVEARPDLLVVASGNLAMLYLPRFPGRLTLERMTELHPDLVAGLAKHPGIGFVVVETNTRGPVAIGIAGLRTLRDNTVIGHDPLAPYGEQIAADLLEHSGRDHVGDIVVCSLLEDGTDEVAAFEELVGCHGGAGGAQTQAVLLHPASWALSDPQLTSSDQLHRQLVRWLEIYGRRSSAKDDS
ncbi:alkaline phosphatase family protein [Jatrophihabitans sp. DSM 45814]